MPLRTYNPITPSSRYKVWPDFKEITKSKPEKQLTEAMRKSGGRNNQGRITCRHKGGGHRRRYRLIDFKRQRRDVPAKVIAIEYDPNRTSRIALIEYPDGQRSYILAPGKVGVGTTVQAGENAPIKAGNALPLSKIPLGTAIHNIELLPGRGGKLVRSAGQSATLSHHDENDAAVKLPSGEIRRVPASCYATIGAIGNSDHMNVTSGKAGRSRWKGIRPTVRGMCMNPVDHPNGGGEGKSKSGGGRQHLKSPWGHTKGQRTRKVGKASNKDIIKSRRAK